jgi:hypothetical protein
MKPIQIHTIHPKGWPVTFVIEPADPKLNELIAQLTKLGFRPNVANEPVYQRTPKGLPICPKHNHVMAKREKRGDTWFSHPIVDPATGEKHYCRGYDTEHGSGWHVDLPVAV